MIRSSNKRSELVAALSALIPEAQAATSLVDGAAAEHLGVNRTDLRCLGELLENGRISAGGLAERVGLTRGAMTTAIDRLEEAGHVRRVSDPDDRRGVLVEATPAARRAVEKIWAPLGAEGLEVLERYTDAELDLLRRFFEDYCALNRSHSDRIRKLRKRRRG